MPATKRSKLPQDSAKVDPRAEQLIQRLLDAATQLFMEKGYDATSMGEIAARARASKETFYRHYPNKDELFRAVVIRRAETIARDLGAPLDGNEPPEQALTAFGERILARMTTEDSIAFHRALSRSRERFPELLQLFRETGPHHVEAAVVAYLKQQMAAGRLRRMNAEVAARQFFDLAAAQMIINASMTGKANPSKAAIRQRVKEAVDCFLHGYGA